MLRNIGRALCGVAIIVIVPYFILVATAFVAVTINYFLG